MSVLVEGCLFDTEADAQKAVALAIMRYMYVHYGHYAEVFETHEEDYYVDED